MASEGLHEAAELLDEATIDRHRAYQSLKEELEAADWYDQRVTATKDPTLAAVLAHNRDEEKEHAAMTLEWLRRHDPKLDEHLRTYLFTEGSILAVEAAATGSSGGATGSSGAATGSSGAATGSSGAATGSSSVEGSLGMGSLKGSSQGSSKEES
jgi:hypothetical protein